MLFTLLILFFGVFSFISLAFGLIYRKMYKRLRYLALSGCEFKEKKGDLIAHHPLMKENRWELLTEAYEFASKLRNHFEVSDENLELESLESKKVLEDKNEESDQYTPGQWKSKNDIFDK